jgi:hypothetical protein
MFDSIHPGTHRVAAACLVVGVIATAGSSEAAVGARGASSYQQTPSSTIVWSQAAWRIPCRIRNPATARRHT